ncbi:hypothetical protein B0O99DRAFT_643213 [Bisporella sp. PMI_857]|nr:hypothetical protein B0O99DRAFT_643213 [Bisporella sp. PMI_857]
MHMRLMRRASRVKRHLQKFANAVLQQDQVQFLTTMNNEAKVRRSTKLLVLETAKVMSYEDLEEARAKGAEKEAVREAKSKAKRDRKRKSVALEAESPNTKVARMLESKRQCQRVPRQRK